MKLGVSAASSTDIEDEPIAEEDDDLISSRKTSKGIDGSSHSRFRKHSRTIRAGACAVGFTMLFYLSFSIRQLLVGMHEKLDSQLRFERYGREQHNETHVSLETLFSKFAAFQSKLDSFSSSQEANQESSSKIKTGLSVNAALSARLDAVSKNLERLQVPSSEPDKVVQQQIREVAQHIMAIEKALPDLQGKSNHIKEGMEPLQKALANIQKSLLESQYSTQFHVNYGASISLHLAMVQICGIDKIIDALKSRDSWFQGILHQLDKRDPDDSPFWTRFDFFGPSYDLCPAGKLTSFGDGSGETKVCDLHRLGEISGECKILSIGSDGKWSFEKAIFERTTCEVHTFDCHIDSSPPVEISSRVFGYKKCLGAGHSTVSLPQDYVPYHVILSMIGVRRGPTYLKMYAKGFEWNLLPEILSVPASLPDQIGLELHYKNRSSSLGWRFPHKSPAEVTIFGEMIFRAGFLPLSRRDNMLDSRGESAEFLLARIAQ